MEFLIIFSVIFKRYKYPLEDFVRENKAEDDRCLATVEEQIEKQTKAGVPVAGIVIEPIQAEGGDNHASKEFFQGLDRIAHKYDISLLMDEVQTGGGSTGKMWCHEHFDLEHGPGEVDTIEDRYICPFLMIKYVFQI